MIDNENQLTWHKDDEFCAYNETFGYQISKITDGNVVLRSPIGGSSRHEDMEEAKVFANLDILGRILKEGYLE
jgi:hypothetical protein